jgi:hypothetical protein
VDEQLLELRGEPGIGLGSLVLDGDLIYGGDQRLRDELAAERTEISVPSGDSPGNAGKKTLLFIAHALLARDTPGFRWLVREA